MAAEKAYKESNPHKAHRESYWYIYERTGEEMQWHVPAFCLDAMTSFEIRPSDVMLITAAKAGTTWMKNIISLVMNDANEEALNRPLKFNTAVHYPEMQINQEVEPYYKTLAMQESPRFIPTHLSPRLLPPQVFEIKPKVIYVARNPKDTVVSLYHHYLQDMYLPTYTWDVVLDKYMKGEGTFYGEWKDHVIPWWNRRHEKNVFFVKYEDMIKDLLKVVKELSSFLEQDHLSEEQLTKIASLCTFENLKKYDNGLKTSMCKHWKIDPSSKSPFLRKGKVGGWKDYFTVAQNEEFDKMYEKWIGDSDLEMEFTLP